MVHLFSEIERNPSKHKIWKREKTKKNLHTLEATIRSARVIMFIIFRCLGPPSSRQPALQISPWGPNLLVDPGFRLVRWYLEVHSTPWNHLTALSRKPASNMYPNFYEWSSQFCSPHTTIRKNNWILCAAVILTSLKLHDHGAWPASSRVRSRVVHDFESFLQMVQNCILQTFSKKL